MKLLDLKSKSPTELLEFDHVPEYETAGHTVTSELRLRCSPCHTRRHNLRLAG